MAIIETIEFELGSPADEAAFLAADHRVQTEFIPFRPGIIRRTTARGVDGGWVIVNLWQSLADADAAAELARVEEVPSAMWRLAAPGSIRLRRFTTLD